MSNLVYARLRKAEGRESGPATRQKNAKHAGSSQAMEKNCFRLHVIRCEPTAQKVPPVVLRPLGTSVAKSVFAPRRLAENATQRKF